MSDEQNVIAYLNKRNLQAIRYTKREQEKFKKTPDFYVLKDNNLVFYCEVKTIIEDRWLLKKVKKAPPGAIVGGGRKDPRYNRLSNKIHEAVRQFDSVNPDLKHPNVLVFINHDDSCRYGDLVTVLTGDFFSDNGGRHPIFRKYSEGRIKMERNRIHLFIWIEESGKDYRLFNSIIDQHYLDLCRYFNRDPEAIKFL